ncbi:30S ribosomal protein S6 [candidate division Kazan bacterium RBG_13_50_9]|uniref:Small ribosomal subunit protein bS6 n=1 Tax=candidate division Kazan bacterium RBG_13_50_9 TaxID=1798535 RepID=A0A1F4NS45_UNCK3|nr:MAG: 30S ribosomal protein S6 [candidate division Kazan bacterium RBG_13_50_9]
MDEEIIPSTYELTLLLSPELSDFDLLKVVDKIKASIAAKNGQLVKEHSWGKKQLAYPVRRADFGHYYTLVFTFPPEAVEGLVKELQLTPEIFRHLLISLEKEGTTPDQLFTPEKEEAVVSSAVTEKIITKRPLSAPARPPKAPALKAEEVSPPSVEESQPEDDAARRQELDKKIDELLKEDQQ